MSTTQARHNKNNQSEVIRLGDRKANHLYQLEVTLHTSIEVDANNRSEAARIATDSGYVVRSVNIGLAAHIWPNGYTSKTARGDALFQGDLAKLGAALAKLKAIAGEDKP